MLTLYISVCSCFSSWAHFLILKHTKFTKSHHITSQEKNYAHTTWAKIGIGITDYK